MHPDLHDHNVNQTLSAIYKGNPSCQEALKRLSFYIEVLYREATHVSLIGKIMYAFLKISTPVHHLRNLLNCESQSP
jgi:hypothetical protein